MFKNFFLISIIFLLNSISVSAQENTIVIGNVISIHSDVLNEDRTIWVSLPKNHSPKADYPVLYVLDGDRSFHYASGIVQQLAENGKMPPMIMVGILNTDRNRDLTPTHIDVGLDGQPQSFLLNSGGGDEFLKFLRTELSPYIEANYTSSKFRILAGHSLGGLIVTHALLENPEFYKGYIAIDPSLWWDNGIMNKHISEKLSEIRTAQSTYFMSSANNESPNGNTMLPPQIEFMDNLEKWDTDTLTFKREYFDNDNHGSVDLISFYNGLQFIFKNYELSFVEAVEDPDYLDNHFKALSKRLGYKISPDENTINRLGYTYLYMKKDHDKALELFIQNTKNYPKSSNTYDSLSDAYNVIGNRDMVVKSLEKAIELDPNSELSKRKLIEYLEAEK